MKRNNKEILNKIIEGIEKGNGRVSICKQVGIHYSTFLDWIDEDSPRFNSAFSENIKKAENIGSIKLKEICENVILKTATDADKPIWQAAAWLLERKYPQEYAIKQKTDITTGGDKLEVFFIQHKPE